MWGNTVRIMTTTPADARASLVKAIALLALIVASDLWATHHFGLGLVQLAAIGGVVAVVSGALPFLTAVLTTAEKGGIAKILRIAGRVLLWTPALVAFYVAGAIVALTVSTVRIIGETERPIGRVELTFLGRSGFPRVDSSGREGLVRFTTLTSPFGSPVRLEVAGFAPATFTLYPLGGLTVRLGRDLSVLPTVLFRPGTRALQALVNGGVFRVWMVTPGDSALLAETTAVVVRSSFVMGEPRVIPGAMLEEWRLELTCEEPVIRDQALLAWRRPVPLRTRALRPGPGDRVRAEVWASDTTLVAQTEVVLSGETQIDVPVLNVASAQGGCG